MFIELETKKNIEYYKKMLELIGSLSGLFSESNEPYIAYRVAENLFCKAFDANNLSRSDCSADASKNKLGIGIKTFLEKNGATMQKVAEFNRELELFNNLNDTKKILKISEMRNERIATTKRIFKLENLIYHCVTRKQNGILVYEQPMHDINIEKIQNIQKRKNALHFHDDNNEYYFSLSKNTLYKRFLTKNILADISVKILENPFEKLEKLLAQKIKQFAPIRAKEHIFLPLYAVKKGQKYVPEKSGLNQWNAAGRARDADEIYIPVPAWLHKKFPNFLPPRDKPFQLLLPNGETMSAKMCQQGSKALMSNPNSDLGKWLLREVLNLRPGELLKYEKLQETGLDSVVLYKIEDDKFDIDFTRTGSYEQFEEEFK